MGRVVVAVAIENVDDRAKADSGGLPAEAVRRISIQALVDSGATFLCIPESSIQQLGLTFDRTRETRTITGPLTMRIYRGARIEVQGRACNVEVMALPEGRQPLLGQIPLETLDWWIDSKNQRLVGNPEHGGQWMAEIF
ncbi:MAG: aspartyl protease family protein [Planctomycetes bacterium]|nr:aspartyl protease family protein [Planctomycetota bacterium]